MISAAAKLAHWNIYYAELMHLGWFGPEAVRIVAYTLPWFEFLAALGILASVRWKNAILPAQALSLLFVLFSIGLLVAQRPRDCACFPGVFTFSTAREHLAFSFLLFFGCLWIWRMECPPREDDIGANGLTLLVPRSKFLSILIFVSALSLASNAKPAQPEGPPIGSPIPALLGSALHSNHGYVMVMIFDASCPFCIDSLPHLRDIQADRRRRARVCLVSESTPRESADLIRETNIQLPVFDDAQGKLQSSLHVHSVPYFLLYSDGTLIYEGSGEGSLFRASSLLSASR